MKNLHIFVIAVCLTAMVYVLNSKKGSIVVIPAKTVTSSPISIIDSDGDDSADMTLQRVPFGSAPGGLCYKGKPTPEQQKYFLEHK